MEWELLAGLVTEETGEREPESEMEPMEAPAEAVEVEVGVTVATVAWEVFLAGVAGVAAVRRLALPDPAGMVAILAAVAVPEQMTAAVTAVSLVAAAHRELQMPAMADSAAVAEAVAHQVVTAVSVAAAARDRHLERAALEQAVQRRR